MVETLIGGGKEAPSNDRRLVCLPISSLLLSSSPLSFTRARLLGGRLLGPLPVGLAPPSACPALHQVKPSVVVVLGIGIHVLVKVKGGRAGGAAIEPSTIAAERERGGRRRGERPRETDRY